MIVLTRMKAIEEIDLRNRYAVVQPGVVNAWLNQALKGTGYPRTGSSSEAPAPLAATWPPTAAARTH